MSEAAAVRFLKELRRRRVFRVAGLYVVGVWLLMQAADILLPAWEIPETAIRNLLWAALLGFPVALVFGWIFQVTPEGIRRTRPEWSAAELDGAVPLRRADYLILAAFVGVLGLIGYDAVGRMARTGQLPELRTSFAEITPNSVAVLPFASLSSDPEHEYFADGISEEILDRLSAFGELKVIARTSSFAFKDSGYDIPRISALLAVQYLLQGSVRRDGQQLRVTAQLVDRSGVQVWNSTFDRQLGAIFAMQDEIAEAVATSIVPQIAPSAAEPRLPDLEAYQEYLAGREILASRKLGYATRAIQRLDRAIELDPAFAEPYVERAVARTLSASDQAEIAIELDRAQADIDLALARKPDLARAYAAQGLLMQARDPASPEARELVLRRSLALDPNQVDAWNWLAGALREQKRIEEATNALAQALRLDPLAPAAVANMAAHEIRSGNVAAGEQRLLRALASPLAQQYQYGTLIFLYLGGGRLAEALHWGEQMILNAAAETGRPPPVFPLIGINGLLGRHERAREFWQRNLEAYPDALDIRVWEHSYLSVDAGMLDRAAALRDLERLLPAGGLDATRVWPDTLSRYGEMLALEGRYPEATRLLDGLSGEARRMRNFRGRHALAWAYLQLGERDQADEVLAALIEDYRAAVAAGETRMFDIESGYLTGGLGGKALAMLLSGNRDRALELLDQAAEAGWRGYYGIQRDPRWDQVREDPKFQAIMARVKADIDAQRSQVEARQAEHDFEAQLQAALAAHAERSAASSRP